MMDSNKERDRQDERTAVTALIERAMRGDDSVWGEVYEKTHRYVYFITFKSLRNEQDAQDITHDVYIQVIRSIGQLYSADSFYGWLRRIIFSKCTDFAKKKKPSLIDDGDTPLEEIPEIGERFLPDMVLDKDETRRMVMELVDALPDAQRQSVLFYYYDDMTVDQIAALMECSAGTVKSRLNYARAKIKSGVEEHERKGIKLYGVSALPILAILLREQAQAMEIPSALGAGLAPILSGTSSTVGTTASTSVASGVAKTAATLSAKVVTGIVAAVIVVGGGITALVLTRNAAPTTDAPSGYVSESPSENGFAAAEPADTGTAPAEDKEQASEWTLTAEQLATLKPLEQALLDYDVVTAYLLIMSPELRETFLRLPKEFGNVYKNDDNGEWFLSCYKNTDDGGKAFQITLVTDYNNGHSYLVEAYIKPNGAYDGLTMMTNDYVDGVRQIPFYNAMGISINGDEVRAYRYQPNEN
jgi:RNA polymerase sigma factor (sigma-70 family)